MNGPDADSEALFGVVRRNGSRLTAKVREDDQFAVDVGYDTETRSFYVLVFERHGDRWRFLWSQGQDGLEELPTVEDLADALAERPGFATDLREYPALMESLRSAAAGT